MRTRQLRFDLRQDSARRADDEIDAQLVKQRLVLRIIDTSYRATDMKALFGYLTDHQIILVLTGHGDDDIGTLRTRLFHHTSLAGITAHDDTLIQFFAECLGARTILL